MGPPLPRGPRVLDTPDGGGRRCGGAVSQVAPACQSGPSGAGRALDPVGGRRRAGLAARAPPRAAALRVVLHLLDHADRRPAAQARPPGPAGHPVVAALARVARGHLRRVPAGDRPGDREPEQAVGQVDERRQVDLAHRRPRRAPAQEAQLVGPEVADAGQVALVEQRRGERAARVGRQPPHRLGGVPAGAEQVGPEVADDVVLAVGAQQLDDRHVQRVGGGPVGGQHDAHALVEVAGQPLAGADHGPAAGHPQVRVQGDAAGEPGEQVLAARHGAEHLAAGQVRGGEAGDAQVAAHDGPAGQARLEPAGHPPDAVPLRHRSRLGSPPAPRAPARDRRRRRPGPGCVRCGGRRTAPAPPSAARPGRPAAGGRPPGRARPSPRSPW